MKRQEFLDQLARLPLEDPSPDKVRDLFPHLTLSEIRGVLKPGNYIALPSIKVKGAFQVVNLTRPHSKDKRGPMLESVLAYRVDTSYKVPDQYRVTKTLDEFSTRYPHVKNAMRFAERNWGHELVEDDWVDSVEICVDSHIPGKGPQTVANLYIGLAVGVNKLGNTRDPTTPYFRRFDDAIHVVGTNIQEGREIRGGRGGFRGSICAYDGQASTSMGCSECSSFYRDSELRGTSSDPVTPKMRVALNAMGHTFGQDPQILWDKLDALHRQCYSNP